VSESRTQIRSDDGEHRPDLLQLAPVREGEEPSSYADDPMTRLWQHSDRDTGAEAVEAIRVRRRELGPDQPSKRTKGIGRRR
jgi:hypothetical protein